ncbi:MAG TPA: hypothetical protein VNN10_16165 [Dehalococcoidia bacterium]|nr:hypothetical protein [Dehalococcoidia bacterium]
MAPPRRTRRRRSREEAEQPAPEVEVEGPEAVEALTPALEEAFDLDYEPSAPEPDLYHAASARPTPPTSRLALLVAVYGIGLLLFLAVEPTRSWMLLLVTALVTISADGILRTHPRGDFQGDIAGTAPFLFLPALFTLGSGLFMEDVLRGYWAVPGVFAGCVLMALVMYADYASVDVQDHMYPLARLVLNIGTYLTAFAFYSVAYTFDVSLVPASVAVGLVTLLLSVEVLREAEADPVRALVYAAVVGLVVAEARWALYFLPLESYLAAVFLLIVFYMASGLVQHHLSDDLRGPVILEFVGIAIVGVLIVALGRIFEASGSL